MLDKVLQLKNKNNSVSELILSIRQGIPSAAFGVSEPFKNFIVGAIEEKVLLVVKDNMTANHAKDGIEQISNKKVVIISGKEEILLYSRAFSKDGVYSRIMALSKIDDADVIITTPEALMQLYPKNQCALTVEKHADLDQTNVISTLVKMGYERVEGGVQKGTFSLRGDVLDVFAINLDNPVRIDFFGDTVESIKKFDSDTRENLGYENSVNILQATEFIFDNGDLDNIKNFIKNELNSCEKQRKERLKVLYGNIENDIENKDFDLLTSLCSLNKNTATMFDILPNDLVVIFDEPKRAYEIAQLVDTEFCERYNSLYSAGEVFSCAKNNFLGLEKLTELLKKYRVSALQTLSASVQFFNPLKIVNPQNSSVSFYQLDFKEVYRDIDNWLRSKYNILVCTDGQKRAEQFSFDLSGHGIGSSLKDNGNISGVIITPEKLNKGFVFHEEKIVVIGSGNLYNKTSQKRVRGAKKQKFFSAPEVGDYCVHEVHGIGRVLGTKKISSTEGTKDYVAVEYAGGDVLYVPVEQMDILTRYLGGAQKPHLSKIGGKDFERIKNRARESIKKMSFDLKELYNQRQSAVGFKFNNDSELQQVFDSAFPFEETFDQLQAIKDIYSDMQSNKVMDRLVCGDVGFGKTEVAFRAVFLAIANGKQCAMLAPTTILCEQHYNTAVERFKGFGIKIACLNRFKTKKQQKEILDKVKSGEIEFVIGTHRLLSKDVSFKDLGLLVLDEEQRFGVEHKEKIKLLKANVDTLTLSATPIPRTLHMSLSGIRSISTINTPPKKRLPVQIYVTEQTDVLIKDAVNRELNRGGQVFILYNKVESIFAFAEKIKNLVPNAKLTVAHGQMEERVLENNILSFYNHESDLLISTTIIENGIDLPKANTIIVIDADRLGLSTLYQLKGRVGRSDRLAYAYFTFQREKILSDTAFERLNAIIEFTEMGSGIKIAMRDLEIRGAGNILGAEQHGHMDKIGYELYSKLLREELSGKQEIIPELDVRVSAFIPDDYIESNVLRMDVYKEIAELKSLEEERQFIDSLSSTYGALPQEVENLINIALVKLLASKIGASEVVVNKDRTCILFDSFKAFGSSGVQSAVEKFNKQAVISMSKKAGVEIVNSNSSNEEMLLKLLKFLLLCKID